MKLRPYQQKAVNMTWDWISRNEGNPVLSLPTGAGKSVIVAELCRQAVQAWGARILMLVDVQELVEQNAEKMFKVWPFAPLGVYSAGLGRKEVDAITFASIQSIHRKPELIGHRDIVIVDEAHAIGHKDEGTYRGFLTALAEINPGLRVIGLTASPYRLGHGLITDKPAIFDAILEPVSIVQLQAMGYLTKMRSKLTAMKLDTEGVHKRGGDYIESELQAHVDQEPKNVAIVEEVIRRAEGRKSWLFFCSGVQHALHICEALRIRGVSAEVVTGDTAGPDRERILAEFKAGKITALCNVQVLTKGFDAPNTDLIALLRATESPGLYLQMVGRGFRVKEHTDHCLVLDFAGVIERHGPITELRTPDKYRGGDGIPPSKGCPECGEIVATSKRNCPACGYEFPKKEKKLALHDDDIMGQSPFELKVKSWTWNIERSKKTDLPMIVVTYYGGIVDSVKEYLCLWHDGFAGQKGKARLLELARGASVPDEYLDDEDATGIMERAHHPVLIRYKLEGKYPRIVETVWYEETDDAPF